MTFGEIEAAGADAWLAGLREDLVSKTYQPDPVRRVMIPKPGGGERPLGIPTIRDRVVQAAAKIVLEPIFEADFEDGAYGYRPRRSAIDAVKETHRLLCRGYTDVSRCRLVRSTSTRSRAGPPPNRWPVASSAESAALVGCAAGAGRGTGMASGNGAWSSSKSNTRRAHPQGEVSQSTALRSLLPSNRFLKNRIGR